MKKLFTILAMMCLTMVAQAQEVTTWETAGLPVTFEEFVASAGTGNRYVFRMPSISKRGWCDFTSVAATDATDVTIDNLFSIETSTTDDTAFKLKRFKDGQYLLGTGSSSDWVSEEEATDLYLENRTPGFTDPEEVEGYGVEENAPHYISMDNIEGNHFNNGNFGFRGGTGGWSAYFAYGPIYVVTVKCIDEYGENVSDPVYHFAFDGATFTFTAPEVMGFTCAESEASVTVSGADAEHTFVYASSGHFDYKLVVTGAPEGAKLSIMGEEVDINATEYSGEYVVEPDFVEVIFPEEYYYMTFKVNVADGVITVKCYDARYAVNFDLDQTYTRDDRNTTWVALGDQKIEWEFEGKGVEPVYRDMTDQVIMVPQGATVTPSIGYNGQWMHGFLYIDLNNDGEFTVDEADVQTPWSEAPNGELVSYKNQGNVLNNGDRTLPDVTIPNEPGTYRARFKVDWASTDPGGNPGADPDDVTSSNHIVANGGAIIDVMISTAQGFNVTYQVLDENGAVLAEKKGAAVAGATISAVPSELLIPGFYDYSEVTPVTVTGDVTVTTTATPKEDPIFQFTADTSNPVWYNLTIRPDNSAKTGYPTYDSEADPNVTLPNTLTENETTQWAFIGSPYKGFTIVNNAAGTDLVLGAENAFDDYDNGGETAATLDAPGTRSYETWMVASSKHATNGFFLYNKVEVEDEETGEKTTKDQYLNRRYETNLSFWTGGYDMGSTFVVSKPRTGADILAEAQHQLEEMTVGTSEVQIGYPTAEALADYKSAVEAAAADYNSGSIDEAGLSEALTQALETVKSVENTSYEPRTDVYYTITNARGSINYDPEKAEFLDEEEHEFLWITSSLDKDDPNHQWGVYKKGEDYYLYNVGKVLFANMTQSGSYQNENGDRHTWMFSNKPARMSFNAGENDWVVAPGVRIQGTVLVIDEYEDEYENTYAMSISPSYRGPVISYDAEGDGGVPMTFALATSEQDPEVTAAIEELLDPDGIEVINGQTTVNNGAIYNLQGQRVNKAQKGVYIINNKKVVVK